MKRYPLALILCFAGAAAHAGVILETVSRNGEGQETAVTTTQIDKGMARVEKVQTGQTAAESATIFKHDSLCILNHTKKTYIDVDRQSLQRATGGVDSALKQVEGRLSTMSPEQRAMIEKMMGNKLSAGEKPGQLLPQLTRTIRTEHVGTYTCQVWEGQRDGVKVVEHCVVPYAQLSGGAQLAEVLGKVAELAEDLQSGFQSQTLRTTLGNEFEGYKQLDGYPVLTRTFSDGKVQHERVLRSVRNSPVSASSFEVPSGYSKQDLLKRG